jgi:hypothetical protein
MAEIKMDISEYEALKKVEVLLVESKAEQKKLYEELDKAQKEKIEVLNQMAYQVLQKKVITHKHYRIETPNEHLFDSFIRKWEEFSRYNSRNNMRDHIMGYDSRGSKEYLCRAFFDVLGSVETSVAISENQEEISYKGLDVVREEITAEITSQIDKKCQEALDFQIINKGVVKLHVKNETEIIPKLNRRIDELEEKLTKVSEKSINTETELFAYKEVISRIMKEALSATFFTRKLVLSNILTYINNTKAKYENKN